MLNTVSGVDSDGKKAPGARRRKKNGLGNSQTAEARVYGSQRYKIAFAPKFEHFVRYPFDKTRPVTNVLPAIGSLDCTHRSNIVQSRVRSFVAIIMAKFTGTARKIAPLPSVHMKVRFPMQTGRQRVRISETEENQPFDGNGRQPECLQIGERRGKVKTPSRTRLWHFVTASELGGMCDAQWEGGMMCLCRG